MRTELAAPCLPGALDVPQWDGRGSLAIVRRLLLPRASCRRLPRAAEERQGDVLLDRIDA
jgi:hypothetical protein